MSDDVQSWAPQTRSIADADLMLFLEVESQAHAASDQTINPAYTTLTTTARNVTVALQDPDGRVARWYNDLPVVVVNDSTSARLADYTSAEAEDGREYILLWARLDTDQSSREISNQGRKKSSDVLVMLHFDPTDWTRLNINFKTGKELLDIIKNVAGKAFPGAVRVIFNRLKDGEGNVTPFKKSALLIYNDVSIMPTTGFPTFIMFGNIAARVWVPPPVCDRLGICKVCYSAPVCKEGRCRMQPQQQRGPPQQQYPRPAPPAQAEELWALKRAHALSVQPSVRKQQCMAVHRYCADPSTCRSLAPHAQQTKPRPQPPQGVPAPPQKPPQPQDEPLQKPPPPPQRALATTLMPPPAARPPASQQAVAAVVTPPDVSAPQSATGLTPPLAARLPAPQQANTVTVATATPLDEGEPQAEPQAAAAAMEPQGVAIAEAAPAVASCAIVTQVAADGTNSLTPPSQVEEEAEGPDDEMEGDEPPPFSPASSQDGSGAEENMTDASTQITCKRRKGQAKNSGKKKKPI
jgi:hypothetical protein